MLLQSEYVIQPIGRRGNMEKDILRDLYYGRLSPWEMTFRKSSEYARALTEVVACGDRLRDLLTEEDRALVDKMENAQNHILGEAERKYFFIRFRLGAKMMLSVLNGESDTFREI